MKVKEYKRTSKDPLFEPFMDTLSPEAQRKVVDLVHDNIALVPMTPALYKEHIHPNPELRTAFMQGAFLPGHRRRKDARLTQVKVTQIKGLQGEPHYCLHNAKMVAEYYKDRNPDCNPVVAPYMSWKMLFDAESKMLIAAVGTVHFATEITNEKGKRGIVDNMPTYDDEDDTEDRSNQRFLSNLDGFYTAAMMETVKKNPKLIRSGAVLVLFPGVEDIRISSELKLSNHDRMLMLLRYSLCDRTSLMEFDAERLKKNLRFAPHADIRSMKECLFLKADGTFAEVSESPGAQLGLPEPTIYAERLHLAPAKPLTSETFPVTFAPATADQRMFLELITAARENLDKKGMSPDMYLKLFTGEASPAEQEMLTRAVNETKAEVMRKMAPQSKEAHELSPKVNLHWGALCRAVNETKAEVTCKMAAQSKEAFEK